MGIKTANVILNSRNVYLQGNKTWKQSVNLCLVNPVLYLVWPSILYLSADLTL